jgi:hypothetical protein
VIWRQSTPVRDQLDLMRRRTAGGAAAGRRRRPRPSRLLRTGRATAPMLFLLALNFAAWLGIYLLVTRLLR